MSSDPFWSKDKYGRDVQSIPTPYGKVTLDNWEAYCKWVHSDPTGNCQGLKDPPAPPRKR